MKILVINPNTSEEFNRKLNQTAKEYALPSTEVKVISPKSGPKSIEGIYDEALSVQGTIQAFIDHERGFDGCVVACYSDPRLSTPFARSQRNRSSGSLKHRSILPACSGTSSASSQRTSGGVRCFMKPSGNMGWSRGAPWFEPQGCES